MVQTSTLWLSYLAGACSLNASIRPDREYVAHLSLASCDNAGWYNVLLLPAWWKLSVSHLVGACSLIAVTRPEHENVGHGSEGRQVLHRLVGGAVLPKPNAVVGHHKDSARLQGNEFSENAAVNGQKHGVLLLAKSLQGCV